MNVNFSTNQAGDARQRIKQALGKHADKDEAFVDYLCSKVSEGVIRIGDPFMYSGTAPIYPTSNASGEDIKEIKARCEAFQAKCK